MFVFPPDPTFVSPTFSAHGFIVGLISRCCSRRVLVERSLCLKWLTMYSPTSCIPAILFLNFADDALQVTSPQAHSKPCNPYLTTSVGPDQISYRLLKKAGPGVVGPLTTLFKVARDSFGSNKMCKSLTNLFVKTCCFWHKQLENETILRGHRAPFFRKWVRTLLVSTFLSIV